MIVLFNGRIGLPSEGFPLQTAIAVEGYRILAAGSDADVLNLTTSETKLINLHGKTVWPGLTDSARVTGIDDHSAKLIPGYLADLIVLSCDLFQMDAQEIYTIKPERVMANGVWVFQT